MVDLGDMTISALLGSGVWYWAVYAVCAVALVATLVKMYRYVSGIKCENNSPIE